MKISVVTAVYNAVSTVGQALASVAAQRGVTVEHVVIDGASNDGTVAVLQAHRASISTLVSEPDGGIYDALNKGIGLASGDVVGFLHADDFYAHPDVLARVAQAFADPGIDAVYGDLDYVRKDDPARPLRHWVSGSFTQGALSRGWMPPHPTLYMRRALYLKHGGFDTSYRISADYECVLRVFSDPALRIAYLPEVLVKMRVGGASNRSLRNIWRKSREDYRALKAHRVGGVLTLAQKNLSKLPQFFTG